MAKLVIEISREKLIKLIFEGLSVPKFHNSALLAKVSHEEVDEFTLEDKTTWDDYELHQRTDDELKRILNACLGD